MRFKSVNGLLKLWTSCALACALGFSTLAEAQTFTSITTTPGSSLRGGSTIANFTSYYFANWTLPSESPAFFLNSDTYLGRSLDPALTTTSVFSFDISSSVSSYAATAGQTLYLIGVLTNSGGASPSGNTSGYVTFSDASGNDLTSTSLPGCLPGQLNYSARCVAFPFNNPGKLTTVLVKPGAVCLNGATEAPCNSSTNFTVTSQTSMYISFRVVSVPTTNTSLDATPPTTQLESGTAILKFQVTKPSIACSGDRTYFPGDGQIFVDLAGISVGGTSAPVLDAVAGFNVTQTQLTIPSFTSGSDSFQVLQKGIGVSTNSVVSGMTNSTSSKNYYHHMVFGIRDATGLTATGGCGVANAQSSEIRGFLKDSRCFIATAAYASADVPPVRMLRSFRDQVLAPTEWGREFIAWYYAWSPGAADWLLDRPIARAIALVALIPVEVFAWLALNVGVALSFLILGSSFIAGVFAWRSRRGWA